MKKLYFLIVFVFLIVFFSQTSFALKEYDKSLAYDWLYDVMDNVEWNKKVDEISLSLLALSAEDYDVSLGVEKLYEEQSKDFSWNRNLENSAWATFALGSLGYGVDEEINWLLSREEPARLDGDWLIQVIANGQGNCKISYDGGYSSFTIDETTIVSGCDENDPWIDIVDCVKHSFLSSHEIFSVACDHTSYEPSLLFKKNSGEYYILGEGDLLEVNNGCYKKHGSCDCLDTGYVTWALKELDKSNYVETYLKIDCTSGDMQNAFLYLITKENIYAEKLKESQKYGRWNDVVLGDTFTTAFVIMSLKSGSSNSHEAVENATDWLKRHQDQGGSWDQSIKDTAMVLYSLYGSGYGEIEDEPVCGDGYCGAGESITCPGDCEGSTGTCDDDGIVDEAAGEECDAKYYSNGTLKSGNDSACDFDEWCVECTCQFRFTGDDEKECDISLGDECEISSDCGLNEYCDTDSCECKSSLECEKDDDCWSGEICEEGICVLADECDSNSDCDDDEECYNGECIPLGTGEYEDCDNDIDDDGDGDIDCFDSDCANSSYCEGGSSLVWFIAIIIIVAGLGGGYFVYIKYFKGKKQRKKPTFDEFLKQRTMQKPVQVKSIKKAKTNQYPVSRPSSFSSSGRDIRLEKQLDESLKKARDLLKKK